MPPRLGALLCGLLLGAVLTAPALGATAPAVLDCTVHNGLTKHYTVAELRTALATMPAEIKEYTSCSDILQRALDDELAGLHVSGGGASGGGGSFLPLPVIIVLIVILLGGAGYGALQLRRRTGLDPPPPGGDAPPPARPG